MSWRGARSHLGGANQLVQLMTERNKHMVKSLRENGCEINSEKRVQSIQLFHIQISSTETIILRFVWSSGFHGSSTLWCWIMRCFFIAEYKTFSEPGSEIIRTAEQQIPVCFGISTKGQWAHNMFHYRRQMWTKKPCVMYGLTLWDQ